MGDIRIRLVLDRVWLALCAHAPCLRIEKGKKIPYKSKPGSDEFVTAGLVRLMLRAS